MASPTFYGALNLWSAWKKDSICDMPDSVESSSSFRPIPSVLRVSGTGSKDGKLNMCYGNGHIMGFLMYRRGGLSNDVSKWRNATKEIRRLAVFLLNYGRFNGFWMCILESCQYTWNPFVTYHCKNSLVNITTFEITNNRPLDSLEENLQKNNKVSNRDNENGFHWVY